MIRYSKAEREQAAEVLAICADLRQLGEPAYTGGIVRDLGLSGVVAGVVDGLADAAWRFSWRALGCTTNSHLVYLEAEALIRDGWSP